MQPLEPLEDTSEETNFESGPVGPSSQGCCKVTNRNSCGSGSLVGTRNGKSIVLTNAHVAGTRIGHTVICTFPFANNKNVRGRVIMAGYSDRVMMDWAVLELEEKVDLPHVKLSIDVPSGGHYTAGYPRCRGPYFQKIQTRRITHNGTVWRWQPNSIGGQSGSGVHSVDDDLQRGLLTWSWGGDGAGQTCRSIWFQYVNRAAVGFARPEGLIELADEDNRAQDLESGFFAETNITQLPIWAHLDEDDGDDDDDDAPDCGPFADAVLKQVEELQAKVAKLAELARKYKSSGAINKPEDPPPEDDDDDDDTGPLFGL